MQIEVTDVHTTLIISNNDVVNENFVDLIINEEDITVSIDELYIAVKAFKDLKKETRRNDLFYKTMNND